MQTGKHLAFGKFILLIALTLFVPLRAFSADCRTVGQLVSIDGLVEKKFHGAEEWQAALLDDTICEGDALRTFHKSKAAVRLIDDTLVRLDGASSLTFTQIDDAESTLLDLLYGAVHFISRTTKSLKVRTSYVNAMIEGTEFVVRIGDEAAEVTVVEGAVVASNEAGSVKISANQAAHAAAGQAPVRMDQVKAADAVTWALYYPPLPATPSAADKLAQESVVALVRNRFEEAADLAERALAADSGSASGYMAKSYVDQAAFEIEAALDDMKKAAELAPRTPLVQARLAEVRMMSGDLPAARQAAGRAVALDPELSLAHTVLGFASLRDVNLEAAEAAFNKAITLDSAAPMPRLGLGLVKIRQGALTSGREEIETAALLDPNNALLRSYLGKAYYEEKRDGLALDQFVLAKEFDPNDPTAWYYESILLQSANRPVEALQAQRKAIALNDNRAVYRSRQLMDRDEAARSVSLGRIYNDLNFERQAHNQAANALFIDPANHSAHRLLADSYSGIANLDAARQSELLQSKLTQPLNLDPLQPQLSNANLGLLDGNGPGDLSYNEYNPLFSRNGLALQVDGVIGEQDTWGEDLIVAGLHDRLAFSIGQYRKSTELYKKENNYEQEIANGFFQYQLGDDSAIQLEVSRSKEEKGDVSRRLLPGFLNNDNIEIENEVSTYRLGFNGAMTANSSLLLSAIRKDLERSSLDTNNSIVHFQKDVDTKINLFDAQIVERRNGHSWTVGFSRQDKDKDSVDKFIYLLPIPCPTPNCEMPASDNVSQTRLYGYLYYQAGPSLSLTGGLTSIEEKGGSDVFRKLYPKIGMQFVSEMGQEIRFAVFRNRVGILPTSNYETLEPTRIVGFNQLYDDIFTTDSWNYAAEYDFRFSSELRAGTSFVLRKLEAAMNVLDTASFPPVKSVQDLDFDDRYAALWLNFTLSMNWALGVDYTYNHYDLEKAIESADESILATDGVLDLKTHELSTSLSFFWRSVTAELAVNYFDQKGEFVDNSGMATEHGEDSGVITDLTMNYRFPSRKGSVSIGVKNISDKQVNYEDRSSYDAIQPALSASPSSFSGERVLFGSVSFVFR